MGKEKAGISDSISIRRVFDTEEIYKAWKKENPEATPRNLFYRLESNITSLIMDSNMGCEFDKELINELKVELVIAWLILWGINDE